MDKRQECLMDAELLDDALATALAKGEIAHAIARLADDDEAAAQLREALAAEVRSQASEVESAARDELARLAAAEAELDAALEEPIDATIASTPGALEQLRELSRLVGMNFSAKRSRADR